MKYVLNTTAHRNRAEHSDGGAIYIYNDNRYGHSDFQIRMNTTMVYDNRADQGDGGAIIIHTILQNNKQFVINIPMPVHQQYCRPGKWRSNILLNGY